MNLVYFVYFCFFVQNQLPDARHAAVPLGFLGPKRQPLPGAFCFCFDFGPACDSLACQLIFHDRRQVILVGQLWCFQ